MGKGEGSREDSKRGGNPRLRRLSSTMFTCFTLKGCCSTCRATELGCPTMDQFSHRQDVLVERIWCLVTTKARVIKRRFDTLSAYNKAINPFEPTIDKVMMKVLTISLHFSETRCLSNSRVRNTRLDILRLILLCAYSYSFQLIIAAPKPARQERVSRRKFPECQSIRFITCTSYHRLRGYVFAGRIRQNLPVQYRIYTSH